MTGVDPMTDEEQRLRADLHRLIVPPPTPDRLRLEVDRVAEAAIDAARARRGRRAWWPRLRPAMGGLRLGVAVMAMVVLVAGSLMLVAGLGHRGDVATSSFPAVPTLPAITGPALPSAPASGVLIAEGRWVSPSVAWVIDNAERLRVTTDGGQTWSEPRPLPNATDLGFDLLDASTGYTAWARDAGGSLAITVYRTGDGGRTWASFPVGSLAWADGEESDVDVHFSDAHHGVVLAASWIYGPAPSGGPAGPASPRECLAWTTSDGGATWTPAGGAPCLRLVTWWTPTLGMLMPSEGGGDIAVTRDGGRTWTRGTLPGVADDESVYPDVLVETGTGRLRFAMTTTPRNGTVVGDLPLVVVESGDGGATWLEAYRSTALNALSLNAVTPLGEDHWMATQQLDVASRPYRESVLLETVDGGRSWTQVGTLGTIDGTVQWLDRLHGMAQGVDMGDCSNPDKSCGGSGTMFLTNDGGRTWHRVPF